MVLQISCAYKAFRLTHDAWCIWLIIFHIQKVGDTTLFYLQNGSSRTVFWRPFVKRFALCCRTVVCPVCNVGVLRSNDWTDQGETWRAGRPRPWPHCVRWERRPPPPKGHTPIFGPYLLSPNGSMNQNATWQEGRPPPK